MTRLAFLLSLLFAFCTDFHSVSAAKAVCDAKQRDQADANLAKILALGSHGRVYPETKKELKAFCEESQTLQKALEEHSKKCFRGTLRQYGNLFLFSSKQSLKRFCAKNARNVAELLRAAKCANANRSKLNKCMDSLVKNFVGIKYAKDELKMPLICCQLVEVRQCFRTALEGKCRAESRIMEEVINSVTSNFVESTCGEYNEDTDKCDRLGRAPGPKSSEKVPKSLLFPIYDIINSLPA